MKTIMTFDDVKKNDDGYYEWKIVIKRAEIFKPEYQETKYQLVYAVGGFGCDPTKMGRAVFVIDCCDGEHYRADRGDILGVASDEAIAKWKKMYGEFHKDVLKMLNKEENE